MEEIFKRQMGPLKRTVRTENQKAIQVLTGKGIKLVNPSPQDLKKFQELCERGVNTLGENEFSKKTLEEIRALVKNSGKGP